MEFRYDKHNKYHRLVKTLLVSALSLIALIWVWWMIASILHKPSIVGPADTFEALWNLIQYGDPVNKMELSDYVLSSLKKLIYGFLLALAVALPVGLIMGNVKVLKEFITPMIEVLRPIAPIAWAPIFFIAFVGDKGDTTLASTLVVFIGIVFPLLTNIIFGVTKVDKSAVDASKTLGASNMQIFLKVLLPSTVPYLMNGIKVGLGIGWMCIVAAELYDGFHPGIGSYLKFMMDASAYEYAYAGIIVISVLGLLTTGIAELISKTVNKRMGIDI